MNEWGVVLVIIALVGLATTVGGPVIKLNTSITKLIAGLEGLKEDLGKLGNDVSELDVKNHESHRRIWNHNDEQDQQINDHEIRIQVLEKKD